MMVRQVLTPHYVSLSQNYSLSQGESIEGLGLKFCPEKVHFLVD